MIGALFNLAQMRGQAKSYKGMAEVSRINAQAARAQGRSQAKSIRETAAKNQEIEAQIQRAAQENAYQQVESLRTQQAASGFTAEGSSTEKRIAAQQALNQQIANMAMSASISMSNSWQQATDVERQAEARAINYEGQAAAYAAASKGVRQGMILAAAGGMVGMGLGLYRAYEENEALKKKITPHDLSNAEGLIEKGNIDPWSRKVERRPDGSIATVESFSVNIDGKEVLLPSVIDGKKVSMDDAVAHYKKTGEHLGIFDTAENATSYAQKFHENQEAIYSGGGLEYYEQHKKNVALAAAAGADVGFGVGGIINPYTAALTGDANARKNNWQSFFALTYGNVPYNPKLNNNLYGNF